MLATVLHRPRNPLRGSRRAQNPVYATEAIIKLSATCICGSDLWPDRGLTRSTAPIAHGPRILRRRRGGRQRGREPSGRVSSLLARSYLRQHLPALPIRLPVLLRASRVHERRAGPLRARALGGRYARGDARSPVRRSHSPLPRRLPTCSAPAGTPPTRPACAKAGEWSSWSATARLGSWACSRPRKWALSGLSP